MTDTAKEKMGKWNDLLVSSDQELSHRESDKRADSAPGSKVARGLLLGLVTMLMTSIMLVFSAFSPSLVRVFADTSPAPTKDLTPVDYYQSIEKSNLENQIDAISKLYGSYLDNYKKTSEGIGSEVTMKAEFDKSIAEFMGLEGLKSVKATILSMQTNQKAKAIVSLFTNDNEFTTLNVLIDTEKELEYILIPELSKAYLKISTNGQYGETGQSALPITAKEITALLNDNPLTESLLNKLLKKYAALIVSEMDNAYLSNDTGTAGGVTGDYTKVSVKLNEKTITAILEKILITAKTDKELINLCEKFKICTNEEYEKGIQGALDNLTDSNINLPVDLQGDKNDLIMSIWVDNAGNIIGRDLSYDYKSQTSFIGYKVVKNSSDIGFDAWYTSDMKEELRIEGKVGIGDNGASGDVNLSYMDSDAVTPNVLTLKLEDANYGYKDSASYLNGRFTLTGDSLAGLSVIADFTGNEKQQTIKIEFVEGMKKLVSVMMDTTIIDYKDFNLPSKTAKVYDFETQLMDYISSADLVKYLEDINKKINVEGINNYIDMMLSAY